MTPTAIDQRRLRDGAAALAASVEPAGTIDGLAQQIETVSAGIAVRVNPDLAVHYLDPNRRAAAYALAHRLSVEGRCRDAPHTLSAAGIEFAAERATLSKTQRKVRSLRRSVSLLLERAHADPSFEGDFTKVAESFGWTSGKRWRENPAIRIAADRWAQEKLPVAVQEVAQGFTRREDHLADTASSHAAEDEAPDAVLLPQHGSCD